MTDRFTFTDDPGATSHIGTRAAAIRSEEQGEPIAWATESEVRQLVAAAQAWLDAPPVLVESADGAIAATPIADPPRFTVALLRDVPDGATVVSVFPDRDVQDIAGIARRLNGDACDPDWWDARSPWWHWITVDSQMRAGYEDDEPCVVDTRPEVTP